MRRAEIPALASPEYLEALYQEWRRDPGAVDPRWAEWFRDLPADAETAGATAAPEVRAALEAPPAEADAETAFKQGRLNALLWAFRDVGYFYAHLNPLMDEHDPAQNYRYPRARGAYEQLSLERFGLSPADLQTVFSAGRYMQPRRAPLPEILEAFRQTYCSHVGTEYLHIQNKPIRYWLMRRMESTRNRLELSREQKRIILKDLLQSEEFEHFLHKTFIGQKRFSLEGAEAVIPALHFLADQCSRRGIEQVVLGTTHRGRLTILHLIQSKPAAEIFTEFQGIDEPEMYGGSGDVKYHLGCSTDHRHDDGSAVHIAMVSNPSHLESVDAVVEGKARGVQDKMGFIRGTKKVLPVILHGDAAFSGQGVVAENFNLSQLRGYETGGTVHIVINNQIGFTASMKNSRSTFFPTDFAKATSVPVFHVNGDDPEAVVHTVDLALEFRQKFGEDAVIDIVCFRRHGHNEGDDPSFTNPRMYKAIDRHPGVPTLYARSCASSGVMSREEQQEFRQTYAAELKEALQAARENPPEPSIKPFQGEDWQGLTGGYSHEPVRTGVERGRLEHIAERLTAVPAGFNVHRKLERILKGKAERLAKDGLLDWAFAESLAFGSLLLEGVPVRLSGQDCERGTFSQRHATWWDTETEEPVPYTPLNNLADGQALFHVYNSPLSEYSILGFEYGFSLSRPRWLTIWEAQFGDFANGAQVVIDNFIAAAERKWQRYSGLVLLLPHGYEGQGPEHSSAHLERYLQLCGEENIQVCNATTPAQYFHLLRRQMHRDFRKPLVVMTPKSLLRHPLALSRLEELTRGHFLEVLDEPAGWPGGEAGNGSAKAAAGPPDPQQVRRLILCSGKIYYELWEKRRELQRWDTALVRMEQLYPFPREQLAGVLERYPGVKEHLWAQEEPENRGALTFMRLQTAREFPSLELKWVSRPASASPATGSHRQHEAEQRTLAERAFGREVSPESAPGHPEKRKKEPVA